MLCYTICTGKRQALKEQGGRRGLWRGGMFRACFDASPFRQEKGGYLFLRTVEYLQLFLESLTPPSDACHAAAHGGK